jgi:tRNA-splicing ligase RtcB
MGFAEASREVMYQEVVDAFNDMKLFFTEKQKIDTHHNFAEMENHFGQNYLVHRKGAVKASGLVTIPGSMGTASYICEGLMNAESFCSCSHGAGRMMGRKQANRSITFEQAKDSMKDVVFGVRAGDYDEMPMAYKKIEKVIEDQTELVKPVYKLKPMAVCKG